MTGKRFKHLPTEAQLLYGLLLDRMGLSAKNSWHDEAGRVYIYYTLREIQENFNCGHGKATKLLVELDSGRGGFDLIERVKQGIGLPAKSMSNALLPTTHLPKPLDRRTAQIYLFPAVKTSEIRKSRLVKIGSLDFRKPEVKSAENPHLVILS